MEVTEIHQSLLWIRAHLKVLGYTFQISKLYKIRHQLGPTVLLNSWGKGGGRIDSRTAAYLARRNTKTPPSPRRRHTLTLPHPANTTVELPALDTHPRDLELGLRLTLSHT